MRGRVPRLVCLVRHSDFRFHLPLLFFELRYVQEERFLDVLVACLTWVLPRLAEDATSNFIPFGCHITLVLATTDRSRLVLNDLSMQESFKEGLRHA